MQHLSLKKLSHCNNSTIKQTFEALVYKAFFLLEGIIAILAAAIMAGVLSLLVSYAAAYSTRMQLLHGALEVACSALDAVLYGAEPLGGSQQVPGDRQGDYMVTVLPVPNNHTQDAVMVRVSWIYRGMQEQLEISSVRRKL